MMLRHEGGFGMRSGELARLAGVSPDTLRHYESLGLLQAPRRTSGNYREYSSEAAERVQLIRNALAMGFSLKELSVILRVRDQGGVPCAEVRRMAGDKVVAITEQIEALMSYRDRLQHILAEWDVRLRQTGRQQRAYLLQALALPPARPGAIFGGRTTHRSDSEI
jgi:MerR family Zn(II)-responsive transcriptional regulator of zntA